MSVEADGKPVPADRTKGWTLTIDGPRYALRAGGRVVDGEYKLSPLKNPHAIDATRTGGPDKGKTLLGVYDVQGDDLKMCFGRPRDEVRPKEFKTGGEGGGDRAVRPQAGRAVGDTVPPPEPVPHFSSQTTSGPHHPGRRQKPVTGGRAGAGELLCSNQGDRLSPPPSGPSVPRGPATSAR